mmetsp:Transcript_56317/g.138361  ORF Transcript_56317/g.138361 Transcript_56317/m.138361 type:complete len:83 (-) Transcript_56317:353-601(-)|eukprot:CAMPEP_0198308166 /NCGR_PEP_ID=MMETSP1450-20131203/914_1 /TAXON_ID=753684 ORGANISM="Madagascaria erythrocladiodes, Strain CCMP3234" /NCGR_SAMPLE_ID=MMETSP1450 /ASSEMBLY_ACC=CAM_ASM_001115 /LENGTH=82 /DNA_ID=CAMNT_0044010809 /DNA_START=84 /DNA_END=332 /DNA_ORIENTATION=-
MQNQAMHSRVPVQTACPSCQQQVQTVCVYKPGLATHLACLGVCLILELWCGCCLIPYMIDDLKDCHHMCPNCNAIVAVKKVI